MLHITRFIIDLHLLTILPSLVPYRMMLAVPSFPHGLDFTHSGWDTLLEWLRTGPLPVLHALLGYCWRNSRFDQRDFP